MDVMYAGFAGAKTRHAPYYLPVGNDVKQKKAAVSVHLYR